MPDVLMVIAPEVFRDEEYTHPREVLERRGATVITASTRPGLCTGKLGMTVTADAALGDVDSDALDAVVFVGGGGAQVFFDDPKAHQLARTLAATGRVVAAICIAPSTLAHAGLLAGRRVTSFSSQEFDLDAHGAIYTGEPVEVDANFITANGPEAAYAFGEAIADMLNLPEG